VYPLRERVQITTIEHNSATTFKLLVSRLRDSGIDVEKEDEAKGLVVAHCLSLVVNWIFWRAWSDKLFLEMKEMAPNKTEVRVYAIPNLSRYKVRKNEKALDRGELTRLVGRLLA
jgi:hypothetical protein